MSFAVEAYDKLLVDLCAGSFTSATTINALLLKSTYTFDRTHLNVAAVSANECSGGSYARFTGAGVFTVAAVGDEVQYQVLTPAVTFASFTAADWRYIVLYNSSSNALYLNVDTGITNVQAGTGYTLNPGTDPFIRVAAP